MSIKTFQCFTTAYVISISVQYSSQLTQSLSVNYPTEVQCVHLLFGSYFSYIQFHSYC